MILFETGIKISDTDFQQYYPNISSNISTEILEPYERVAWYNHMHQYVGLTLAESLKTASSGWMQEAGKLAKTALAHFLIFEAMPSLNITVDNAGIKEGQAPSKWSFDQARWSAVVIGERALADLLSLLVDNIGETELATYAESQYYGNHSTRLYKEYRSYLDYSHIHGMKTYLAMRRYITMAEDDLIEDIVSEEQFATSTDSDNSKDIHLLILMRRATAAMSMIHAIPALNVYITNNSVLVLDSIDGMNNTRYGVNSRDNKDAIDRLLASLRVQYAKYVGKINVWLSRHEDHFTEWADLQVTTTRANMVALDDGTGDVIL